MMSDADPANSHERAESLDDILAKIDSTTSFEAWNFLRVAWEHYLLYRVQAAYFLSATENNDRLRRLKRSLTEARQTLEEYSFNNRYAEAELASCYSDLDTAPDANEYRWPGDHSELKNIAEDMFKLGLATDRAMLARRSRGRSSLTSALPEKIIHDLAHSFRAGTGKIPRTGYGPFSEFVSSFLEYVKNNRGQKAVEASIARGRTWSIGTFGDSSPFR
jgi:hypothetical protein